MGPLSILLVILLAGLPFTAWGGEDNAAQLRNQYRELRDHAQSGPFGLPLSVQSEDRDDQVSAEVYGIIEHPIQTVKAALSSPASWCEFAPLHLNVKACTFQTQSHETFLTLYLGKKYYQTPEKASPQMYTFAVHAAEPGFLSVALSAPKGLFGTTAHRFELEAVGVDGSTVIALRSSYVPSVVTRVMTAPTPMTIPRVVKAARMMLRLRPCRAVRTIPWSRSHANPERTWAAPAEPAGGRRPRGRQYFDPRQMRHQRRRQRPARLPQECLPDAQGSGRPDPGPRRRQRRDSRTGDHENPGLARSSGTGVE